MVSLSFNISETNNGIQNLTKDVTVTSKVLIDKPRKKHIAISL